jgi:ATP-binding protein involved in chromosome partitioning
MSYLPCPHCTPAGLDHRLEIFGSGGGRRVAEGLSRTMGTDIPLLGEIPLDQRLREGADSGNPLVLSDPEAPASVELNKVADRLGTRPRGLAGRSLGLSPVSR